MINSISCVVFQRNTISRFVLITIISSTLFLASCASINTEKVQNSEFHSDWRNHVVIANEKGEAQNPFDPDHSCNEGEGNLQDVSKDKFDIHPFEIPVETLKKFIKNQSSMASDSTTPIHVVIFIHGGLNTVKDSCQRAKDHVKMMLNDKFDDRQLFPIFLIWPSGLSSAYMDEVTNIRDGRRIDGFHIRKMSMPFHILYDTVAAVGGAIPNWWRQGSEAWGTSATLRPGTRLIKREDTKDHAWNPKYLVALRDRYNDEPWSKVTCENNTIYDVTEWEKELDLQRNFQGTGTSVLTAPNRAVTVPFVSAYGKRAWINMQRRAYATMRPQKDFPSFNDPALDPPYYKPRRGSGAFAKFGAALEELRQELTPRYRKIELSIIGHSMGAIVGNEIVAEYPKLMPENIVYMGAACSIRHFNDTVGSYLKANPKSRFYNLSLHPLAEAHETNFPWPRGSLLDWIDVMYEPGYSGMDRTLGKWDNVRAAKHVLCQRVKREQVKRAQMVFKIFSLKEKNPRSHGDFTKVLRQAPSEDPTFVYWRRDYWGNAALFDDNGEKELNLEH